MCHALLQLCCSMSPSLDSYMCAHAAIYATSSIYYMLLVAYYIMSMTHVAYSPSLDHSLHIACAMRARMYLDKKKKRKNRDHTNVPK